MPQAARDAVRARMHGDLTDGRVGQSLLRAGARSGRHAPSRIRDGARRRGQGEVALTSSTTYGVNTVLSGLRFSPGDEILTSDQEHPGVLAPLRRARERDGVSVRVVPFAELPGEVGAQTRLVACSHVSWVGGEVMDVAALRATGVPILLDAAQALGAIPVDVHELGVDYLRGVRARSGCADRRAAARSMCAPTGSTSSSRRSPGYTTLADPHDPLGSSLAEGAGRLDDGFPDRDSQCLGPGLDAGSGRGRLGLGPRAGGLGCGTAGRAVGSRGHRVAARGRSTLVSWHAADADAEVARLLGEGMIVRSIPSAGLVRASIGAWTSEAEIHRLAGLA